MGPYIKSLSSRIKGRFFFPPVKRIKNYFQLILACDMLKETLGFLVGTLSWTLRATCAAHLVHELCYEFTETRGESMMPTLHNQSDYVHALKRYRFGRGIDMGDCIVAMKPSDPKHMVCKRITGMPGDTILIDPSSSSPLTNSIKEARKNDGFNKYITIPPGHVWCTGDNLCHSLDLRSYSVMPMALITGKIFAANTMSSSVFDDFYNFRWLPNSFISE